MLFVSASSEVTEEEAKSFLVKSFLVKTEPNARDDSKWMWIYVIVIYSN